jgi:predicted metalloprotease
MRWEGNEQSDNVEDRRGEGGGGGGGGGFIGGRGIGIGTIAVALIGGWIFGINPLTVLSLLSGGGGPAQVQQQQQGPAPKPPSGDREAAFVSTVLKNTEVVWTDVFKQGGGTYHAPKLVLFRGVTPTACGTGPIGHGAVLLPGRPEGLHRPELLRHAEEPARRAGRIRAGLRHRARGRPPRADELGITAKVDGMRNRLSQTQNNAMSVRVELQADCFAGVWAHHSQSRRSGSTRATSRPP